MDDRIGCLLIRRAANSRGLEDSKDLCEVRECEKYFRDAIAQYTKTNLIHRLFSLKLFLIIKIILTPPRFGIPNKMHSSSSITFFTMVLLALPRIHTASGAFQSCEIVSLDGDSTLVGNCSAENGDLLTSTVDLNNCINADNGGLFVSLRNRAHMLFISSCKEEEFKTKKLTLI